MVSGRGKAALVGGAFLLGVGLSSCLGGLSFQRPGRAPAPAGAGPAARHGYERVICMTPAVSEIVFAVGGGPRVVGVSEFTAYPPEAAALPKCGGFFDPNRELIIKLAPDLLITQGEAEDLSRFARDHGFEVVSVELEGLESILSAVRRIGEVLDLEPEAELLAAEMRCRLSAVRARVARRPPVKAVLVVGRHPDELSDIYAVGPGEFLDDLIRVAGGRNLFDDLPSAYAVISKEALIERAPDVVVELYGDGSDEALRRAQARRLWQGLPALPAMATGRVYALTGTYAMIPGPRVVRLAEELARLFHGEGRE